MGKENIHGLMEENLMVNMRMIKRMGLVYIFGLMEGFIKDFGMVENRMGLVNIF
jgi:hypothetical protein